MEFLGVLYSLFPMQGFESLYKKESYFCSRFHNGWPWERTSSFLNSAHLFSEQKPQVILLCIVW